MDVIFTLGTLTLIGSALSESLHTSWDKSPIALKKDEVASSYINTLDICPQEVPRCPGKAEPRCIQDPQSWYKGPPSQGNTQWRCVLCEDSTEGTACFMVIPIESYYTMKRPPKPKQSKERNMERMGNFKRFTTPVISKIGPNGTKPLKPHGMGPSWHQPQVQPGIQLLGGANLQNNYPLITQTQPSIPYQQPVNNVQYQQQQYAPPNYGYRQPPYLTYGQNPTYGQPMLHPYNTYLPQTIPYMQSQYQVPPQYSALPSNYWQ